MSILGGGQKGGKIWSTSVAKYSSALPVSYPVLSQFGLKVFMPTSKIWIRPLYVKRFQSSDLFVSFTLPQRGCFIVEVALKPNVLSNYFDATAV